MANKISVSGEIWKAWETTVTELMAKTLKGRELTPEEQHKARLLALCMTIFTA